MYIIFKPLQLWEIARGLLSAQTYRVEQECRFLAQHAHRLVPTPANDFICIAFSALLSILVVACWVLGSLPPNAGSSTPRRGLGGDAHATSDQGSSEILRIAV